MLKTVLGREGHKNRYLADSHIHSWYSFDSRGHESIADLCERAMQLGIQEICITDHLDLFERPGMEHTLDLRACCKEILQCRDKYRQLRINMGVEAGVTKDTVSKLEEILADYELDHIICSQHTVRGVDIFFHREFYDSGRKNAYREALEEQLELIMMFSAWNCLGHLGYFTRYNPEDDKKLRLSDAKELIDEILKFIIENGKGLELNTAGYVDTGDFLPPFTIIQRYRELGGEIVCLGSDCHHADRLGDRLLQAQQILTASGFRYHVTYRKGKPFFHPL